MINRHSFTALSIFVLMLATTPFALADDNARLYYTKDLSNKNIELVKELRSLSDKDNFNALYDIVIKTDNSNKLKAAILMEVFAGNYELDNNTTIAEKNKISLLLDKAFDETEKTNFTEISEIGSLYQKMFLIYSTPDSLLPEVSAFNHDKIIEKILPALAEAPELQYELSLSVNAANLSIARYRTQRENNYSVEENIAISEHVIDKGLLVVDKYMPNVDASKFSERSKRFIPRYPYYENISGYLEITMLYYWLDRYANEHNKLTDAQSTIYKNKAIGAYEKAMKLIAKNTMPEDEKYAYITFTSLPVTWMKGTDYAVNNIAMKLPQKTFENPPGSKFPPMTYKDLAYSTIEFYLRHEVDAKKADEFIEKYGKDYEPVLTNVFDNLR